MKSILYRGGYKYQLVETYRVGITIKPAQTVVHDYITLSEDGMLSIAAGYAWDGPSGPTFDTRNFMRGSLVHDALYQLMRCRLLPLDQREPSDAVLRALCLEDGMSAIRAWWVYQGVRLGGGQAAASPDKPALIAP